MPLSKETFGGSSLHSNVVLSAKQGGIDPIKDERNKITIPQGLHKSMHTTKYYEYVTKKITSCSQTREGVERALLELKLDILYASTSGIRKWDIQ